MQVISPLMPWRQDPLLVWFCEIIPEWLLKQNSLPGVGHLLNTLQIDWDSSQRHFKIKTDQCEKIQQNINMFQQKWTTLYHYKGCGHRLMHRSLYHLPLQTKIYEIDTCTWGYKMPKNIKCCWITRIYKNNKVTEILWHTKRVQGWF